MIFNDAVFLDIQRIKESGLNIDYDFLHEEIRSLLLSDEYQSILDSYKYYDGQHDILKSENGRKEIGLGGGLQPVTDAIDKRIVDNQYAVAVDKKKNYLFGKAFTFTAEEGSEDYLEKIRDFFDSDLMALVNETATDCILAGECYWYPYYDLMGELHFKKLDRTQCFVFYQDEEKHIPESFIHFYDTTHRTKTQDTIIKHLDYYEKDGVTRWENGKQTQKKMPYNRIAGQPADIWEGKLPLIVWKLNPSGRIPFRDIKGAQDALNELKSQIVNNSLEDERTTLLWIENYSGSATDYGNPGQSVRKKLHERGIIFTESIDGVPGGVHTIRIDFEPEKRLLVCDMLKQTIVENMRSFDAKGFREGNPNMLNIRSAYSDMEEDAHEMERQFQSSLDSLLFFIDKEIGVNPNDGRDVDFVFNKTMMMNESEKIQDILASQPILPKKFLIAQHPWVDDPDKMMEDLEADRKAYNDYLRDQQSGGNPYDTFPSRPPGEGLANAK